MKTIFILFLFLGIDATILAYQASELSISASEATILYGEPSFLQYTTKFFLSLFGNNNFALRFFMLILHLGSAVLLYILSGSYIKQEKNRLWLVVIFLLLPGSMSSAVIVNHGSVIIFGTFLYLLLYKKFSINILNTLMLCYFFIEPGFMYMYLGLAFFYGYKKEYLQTFFYSFLFLIGNYFYGFVAHGIPSGHFLDILGVYSAVFTPVVFIYLFYSLYRKFLHKELDVSWFIATTAFLVSVILSFRQRINIEYFAPYLMGYLPVAAELFVQSYRVRLKVHRRSYKLIFSIALAFLFLNVFVVLMYKEFYIYIDNPKHHFVYKMDIAYDLSKQLKQKHINCINAQNPDMQLRLRFYSIAKCNDFQLIQYPYNDKKKTDVTIRYKDKILYKADVTKLNNK